MRKSITENIKRKLYAESMGRCMNPDCEKEIFVINGDIAETAHIIPYSKTKDNSFENLIVLCPNCHTDFDKNRVFTEDEVKGWKAKRQEQVEKVFFKQFDTFNQLEEVIKPILEENKTIFENYYLNEKSKLWDKFEYKILLNNKTLKHLLNNNKKLIQNHQNKKYSNLEIINQFILHIDEFSNTREDTEKIRSVLFPNEINSLFGIKPIKESLIPSVESLECLIGKLQKNQKFIDIILGNKEPYLLLKDQQDKEEKLLLSDTPRLRQKYFEHQCFRATKIRLDSLNLALTYLKNNNISFKINDFQYLTHVIIKGKPFQFIYEYCLGKAELIALSPKQSLTIVNLHHWNSTSSISEEAYKQAEIMGVTLLIMGEFSGYVSNI